MTGWLEAYERLPEDAQARVKTWLFLQKLIAQTLRIPFEQWLEKYIGYTFEHPFDYSFMQATFPEFAGFEGAANFTPQLDAAATLVARVPLRAKNNLGRLSPELQDVISTMLELPDADPFKLLPADVAQLQKIFLKEKPLAKLKKQDFRKLTIQRDGEDMIITLDGGEELVRINVLEFGATMSKALL